MRNMSVCRICLIDSAEKSITELEVTQTSISYKDVFLFCLDILVNEEDNCSSKLCLKCYKNLHLFYDFKTLAQKNDIYWTSVKYNTEEDGFVNEIKYEEPFINCLSDNNDSETEFNSNVEIKIENVEHEESDDELLSVIKNTKDENGNASEHMDIKRTIKREKKTIKKSTKMCDQVCEECGKTVQNLKEHRRLHRPKSKSKTIKCKVCDMTFSSYSSRYKHNKYQHLGVKKKCDICNKEVRCLRSHNLRMHDKEQLAHQCTVCRRPFGTAGHLAVHVRTHSTARPFQCEQCEKTFKTSLAATNHTRRVHNSEKSHMCQYCSKAFFTNFNLKIHLRSHSKERPYRCDKCDKHFVSSKTLKTHQVVHSDLRSFACQLCDMTFKKLTYLRNHMLSHTKVKNHPCKYCGTKFLRSDHRRRHEKTAHESHLSSEVSRDK